MRRMISPWIKNIFLTSLLLMILLQNLLAQTPEVFVDGSSNNFPPINYLNEAGDIAGFGHDLAKAVIEATGGRLESFHSGRWVEVTDALETGRINFIHDTGYTPERTKFFDYTESILDMDEVIFVRENQVNINSFEDLTGRKVACVRRHITHQYLMNFPEINCHVVETPLNGLTALINGDVDAYIYPEQIIHYYAQKFRLSNRVKIVGDPLRTLTWGMTVKKGNRAMLERLNNGLAMVRESGEYQTIYDRYFGRRLLSGYSTQEVGVIAGSLSIASLLTGGIFIMWFFLSRLNAAKKAVEEKVLQRTSELDSERNFITTVLDTQEALVIVMDHNGVVVRFNRACETLSGFSQEDVIGQPFWRHLIPEDQKEKVMAVFQALESGMFPNTYENEWLTREGTQRLVAWSNSAIVDEQGKVAFVVGTGIDITDKKQMEHELLQAERLATLGQLSATVSHELRNPLSVISTSSQVMDRELENSSVDLSRPMDRIKRNVVRCTAIIEDMLEYTNVRKPSLSQQALDPSLEHMLEEIYLPNGIVLNSHLKTDHAVLMFDPERINRVIVNLVMNAIQAMSPDGSTANATGEIDIHTSLEDDSVKLVIEDTGSGLSPEAESKVFTPMFSTKSFGVGLGMAIVKNIITDHGGKVDIKNRQDRHGARVTISFPLNTH